MNDPADEHGVVDIVAITGLGGKAFTSWQCYDGSMWLRDHVPLDIPNSRVLIYGYSSDVGNTDSITTLSEITENFIMDLVSYRLGSPSQTNKRSSLILMGHSTGGLIIKDAWCRCGDSVSPSRVDIHYSISGLVFFGTPHNGMWVGNVLPGLANQASENLIRDIEPGSTYIKALKERFSRATESLSIISCFELRQTPQSELLPDGTIVRSGKSAMNAPESTACLYWANEVRVPINENHSMIAKLAKRDGSAYYTVVENLSHLICRSTMRVPMDFIGDTITNAKSYTYNTKLEESPTLFVSTPKLELNRSPSSLQVRVYVHGVWDMFHYSHVRFLEFAKRACPNTYLVVGVIGDEAMRTLKGTTIMSSVERAEVVRACKYVDEVIEDCPSVLPADFVAQLRIDYFGYSVESFLTIGVDPYKFLDLQGKVFIVPSQHAISSTDIIARIIRDRDTLIETQLKEGVTKAQLNLQNALTIEEPVIAKVE
ncbi:hypothetical protein F5Y02DRAFT_423283 [Annulohypoxylon stygium]|nr:hypothetical protein F5Y02DRAFT_423283 [Annulohypoxylon stygium]